MGEVYRAADTRLNRIVALKILPESVADDPARRLRFEREAEVGSSLSHPHICTVYDVGRARPESGNSSTEVRAGQDSEVVFLVMEYVEGETLESRLTRGALSLGDVMRYAIDITSAVDYAHGRGILHRDLKPANIMITPAGLKLLDFGLARATTPLGGRGISNSPIAPTETLTEHGTILGTLNYMAPEQLEGGSIDERADIFGIGAIIYEMMTGQRAFSGLSPASVIAAVLRGDPPAPSALRGTAPTALERAVLKCLAKDREQRWQTVRDLASELTWIRESTGASGTRNRPAARLLWRLSVAGLLIAATSAATLVVSRRIDGRSFQPPAPIRFAIEPPPGVSFLDSNSFMAASPDGRTILFTGSDGRGHELLWIRSLESLEARPLPGTEGARMPFWAPDSQNVGFFADEKLKTVGVRAGDVRTVCAVGRVLGGAWGPDDVILIGGGARGLGIQRVSAAGGQPTAATIIDASREEIAHNWPRFLPDGRHFLYRSKSFRAEDTAVFAGSLDSPERTLVLKADVNPDFAPPGYLVTGTNGTLVAQPFDLSTRRVTGSPFVLKQPVRYNDSTGRTAASASQLTLVYREPEDTELRWFDRNGRPLQLAAPPGRYVDPELSPDGLRVAVAKIDWDLSTSTLLVIDLADAKVEPVTSGRMWALSPVWSGDGRTLVFSVKEEAGGYFRLYEKRIGDPGPVMLVHGGEIGFALDRTREGTIVSAREGAPRLTMLTAAGVRTQIEGHVTQRQARFSHDGLWMAYASNESGRDEIYIRPVSGSASGKRISDGGGIQPRWRRDDREIFYLAPGGNLMAAEVTTTAADVQAGTPRTLFQAPLVPSVQFVSGRNQYDVSADGQRFIMNVPSRPAPITVESNWQAALRR